MVWQNTATWWDQNLELPQGENLPGLFATLVRPHYSPKSKFYQIYIQADRLPLFTFRKHCTAFQLHGHYLGYKVVAVEM